MAHKIEYTTLSQEDIIRIYAGQSDTFFSIVEDAFRKYDCGEVIMPAKSSQIFDRETQNRINCMPATLLGDRVAGLKWVSVFPSNAPKGIQNVSGIMILSEIETGFPLAVLDGTFLTNVRTAAVGCVAAKYLAPSKVESIGFIGGGSEARMHFTLLKHIFPSIKECRVSSRSFETEMAFINSVSKGIPDVEFIPCHGNSSVAVCGVDIIITAISGQVPILKARDITKGCLYIHVGGWEDEYDVVRKADKIVCDEWESCKHRTQTISRMFTEGLLSDENIYADLKDIISGEKQGRQSDDEFIYFNSVGLSFIDLNFAYETYKRAKTLGLGREVTLSSTDIIDYRSFL